MEPKHRKEWPRSGSDRESKSRRVAEARKIIEDLTSPTRTTPESPALTSLTFNSISKSETDSRRKTSTSSNNSLKPEWFDSIQKDTGELIYVNQNSVEKEKSPNLSERQAPLPLDLNKKKPRKFSPLPRRNKGVTKNGDAGSKKLLNGHSPPRTTKEVVLQLSSEGDNDGDNSPLLQRLCGIVTGRAGVDIFGRTPLHNGNIHASREDDRVAIHALLPNGSAITTGDIFVGDIITAINGTPVTLRSADKVLDALSSENQIICQIERPAPMLPNGDSHHHHHNGIATNDRIIKLLTERTEDLDNSFLEVPHAIMYLNMVRDSDTEDTKEILYQYPQSRDASSSKLHKIQGLFVTLGDMLYNITESRITGTTLLVGEELVHVGYLKASSELLVVALPAKSASRHQVNCITQQIEKLINFMFSSLRRAFSDESNHSRLDHLFNLLMYQLLANRERVEVTPPGDPPHQQDIFLQMLPGVRWLNLPDEVQLDVDSTITDFEAADFADFSVHHYKDRRPYVIIGSCLLYKGYLLASHLPTEDLLDIGLYCNYYSLNGLATQEAVGQLVIWREVHPTRRHHPKEPSIQGYTELPARWFLLIVGLKHSVACTLLEAGGCAFSATGVVSPDPFYVDQLRATLQHLESLEVFAACEERLSTPPIPAISCVDWFFPSRKGPSIDNGQPPLPPSVSASPMISRLHGQTPARGRKTPTDQRPFHNRPPSPSTASSSASSQRPGSVRTESDNESEHAASPFPSRTSSTMSSPSLGRRSDLQRRGSDASGGSTGSNELYRVGRRSKLVPDPYSLGMMQHMVQDASVDSYSATKLTAGQDNTLFHYVHLDSASGVVIGPTSDDLTLLGGNIHAYLLHNFQVCCKEIRKILKQYAKGKHKEEDPSRKMCRDHSLSTVQEYGVLFKCSPPNWTDAKKQPPSVQYWVIGRLVKVASTMRELYVCHHHSASQNTIEMAFKLAYGAGL